MKKGFSADTVTLGGRIRQSRLDAGYTIKDFSTMLGVSANHLGLVERGEKQPSFKLLQKISELSNAPYQWIAKGTLPAPEQESVNVPDALSVTCQNVNLQLFFTLVLTMAPSVSKEMLSNMLNVPLETLEAILRGENIECDIQRRAHLPMLAGLLGDIPAICNDLKNLDNFLTDVAYNRTMTALKDQLIRYIYSKCEQRYKLHGVIGSSCETYASDEDGKRRTAIWTQIALCNGQDPNRMWRFYVIESSTPMTDDYMEQIVDAAADSADAISGLLSYVFLSKSDFDSFGHFANRIMDGLTMKEEGCAARGEPCSIDTEHEFCNLSYILVDSETQNIVEWEPFNDSCDIFPGPPIDVKAIMGK